MAPRKSQQRGRRRFPPWPPAPGQGPGAERGDGLRLFTLPLLEEGKRLQSARRVQRYIKDINTSTVLNCRAAGSPGRMPSLPPRRNGYQIVLPMLALAQELTDAMQCSLI